MNLRSFLPGYFVWGLVAAYVVVAVVVGIAVYRDAVRRDSTFLDLPPLWWAVSVGLLSPLVGLGVYWLLHYSKFGSETATLDDVGE